MLKRNNVTMLGVEIDIIWMSSSLQRSVRRLALMWGLVLVMYVAVLGQYCGWDNKRVKEGWEIV